jgi:hypothetical protein
MRWTAQWASVWINNDASAVTNRVSARNNLDVLYFAPLARKLIIPLNDLKKAVLEQMLRQASGNLLRVWGRSPPKHSGSELSPPLQDEVDPGVLLKRERGYVRHRRQKRSKPL